MSIMKRTFVSYSRSGSQLARRTVFDRVNLAVTNASNQRPRNRHEAPVSWSANRWRALRDAYNERVGADASTTAHPERGDRHMVGRAGARALSQAISR